MHCAILIAIGMVALLCGPICGGVQWHASNRKYGRSPFVYRHVEDEPRQLEMTKV
ncbi:MAG TPA: hypothetical protein VMF58_07895 [Rhizomicrobium sp.]|nr:hypothetical protein [Rhizomicrobium sp.]